MLVVLRPKFIDDISDAYAWLAPENLKAAEHLLARVDATVMLLQNYPLIGASRASLSPGLRSIRLRPFPHLIFYRVSKDEIILVRLLHGARGLETQEYGS